MLDFVSVDDNDELEETELPSPVVDFPTQPKEYQRETVSMQTDKSLDNNCERLYSHKLGDRATENDDSVEKLLKNSNIEQIDSFNIDTPLELELGDISLKSSPELRSNVEETEYNSIRCKTSGGAVFPLSFVERISFHHDYNYSIAFLLVIIAMLIVGFSTHKAAENKHHYIFSLVLGLSVTGSANAFMMAAHYNLLGPRCGSSAPFSFQRLRTVQPLEFLTLFLFWLVMWFEGWGLGIGLTPLVLALFDFLRIATKADNLEFASVVLTMAGELVVSSNKLFPLIRWTWVLFVLQNIWLIVWTSAFVDAASIESIHISIVVVIFLLFVLLWSTQVTQGFLSFVVTGAVCYRLIYSDQRNTSDIDVFDDVDTVIGFEDMSLGHNYYPVVGSSEAMQEQGDHDAAERILSVIFKRGLTMSFGSICAGGLMIGTIDFLAGVLDFLQYLTSGIVRIFSSSNVERFEQSEHEAGIGEDVSSPDRRQMDENNFIRRKSKFSISIFLKNVSSDLRRNANRYSWARISLRGSHFSKSSHEAWSIIRTSGVHGALDADLAESMLRCWSWIFGSLTSLIALLLLPPETRQRSEILFLFVVASFVLGAANASLLFEPLRASTAAIFVAYSEVPHCFAEKYPIADHRIFRLCEKTLLRR